VETKPGLMAARTDNEAGPARCPIYRELLLATTEQFIFIYVIYIFLHPKLIVVFYFLP
jgi:hypothetical protein